MLQTGGVTEIILYVENMDTMVSFYRDILGLRVTYPNNVRTYQNEPSVNLWAGACVLTLRAGGKQKNSSASSKIVFAIRDIEHARSYLNQRDIRIGEVRMASSGIQVCDGFDPEGNPFSLEYQEVITDIPTHVFND